MEIADVFKAYKNVEYVIISTSINYDFYLNPLNIRMV